MHLPLAGLLMMALSAEPLPPGDHDFKLTVDGRERAYRVHVPQRDEAPAAWPVVLAFHGGGSNVTQMISFSGLDEKADEAGFVAVYPSGSGRIEQALTFNGGNCCGYAMRQNVDDVSFVRTLLDDLAARLPVDQKRIFATGMSNGAIMSYRLAAELSDRIAAIAPVAGPMGTETCRPSRPVPVIHFHGTADEFAPLAGGRGEKSRTQTASHE